MRGRGTAVLVAALVLLAGAAIVDALRESGIGGGGATTSEAPSTRAAPTTPAEPDPRPLLADAEIEGVLYATVAEDAGCEFQAIRLPNLATAHYFRAPACRFEISPDERHVAFGSPCPADRVYVVDLDADTSLSLEGCSPAWRPDGRLTYLRRDALVALDAPDCARRGCLTTLASARDLTAELERRLGVRPGSAAVRQIGWFTPRRLVAVVSAATPRRELVAVLHGRRILAYRAVVARSFMQLQVLPFRREASVTSADRIRFVRASGEYGGSAAPVGARAVAVAPSEDHYVATSSGQGCFYLIPRAAPVCIPLEAADLEWR